MKKLDISVFEDTKVAFSHLNSSEFRKVFIVFKIMKNNYIVSLCNYCITKALKYKFPIDTIIKKTVFDIFCGGENLIQTKHKIDNLSKINVSTLLNYSVEGIDSIIGYKETFNKTLESINFAGTNNSIRAICIKISGFVSIEILQKIQDNKQLDNNEIVIFNKAKEYIEQLTISSKKNNVELYIDAEESWFQDTIDSIADELMSKYNKEKAVIYNTFQLYRNDKLEYLNKSIERAKNNNYFLGAKIVRGAYVEKETEFARENGRISPIHISKENTDIDFDKAIKLLLDNIENVYICCASHNEKSNLLFYNYCVEKNINIDNEKIFSSQLLGMSDNITYNLNNKGMNMAKYIPYGPLKEVIPYLIRRAQENTSVKGQTSREYLLLKTEKDRRNNL